MEEARRAAKRTQSLEVCRRAAKHTQTRGEWWRGAGGQPSTIRAGRCGGGGQPSTLRAGRSDGGGQEGSQAHSVPGGVVVGGGRASKHTQSREEWWRGAGGYPSALSREEW